MHKNALNSLEVMATLFGIEVVMSSWSKQDLIMVSFGPSINTSPSPSDPQINRGAFMRLLDLFKDQRRHHTKADWCAKLMASAYAYDLQSGLFGPNKCQDMWRFSNSTMGSKLAGSQRKVCLTIEQTPGKFYSFTIVQKVFDCEDQMNKQFGQGKEGEGQKTILLAQCSSKQTVSKLIAYILSHFNGPCGIKTGGEIFDKIPIFYEGRRLCLEEATAQASSG